MTDVKIAIASHIVIDSIEDKNGNVSESIGGPLCYCGITARRFGCEVIPVTKIGGDFSSIFRAYLQDLGIMVNDSQQINSEKTTRFALKLSENSRSLRLLSKCLPLTVEDIREVDPDCWLVSPVLDEVPRSLLVTIINQSIGKKFLMLDPQGYTRSVTTSGNISLVTNLALDISGVTAVKLDQVELKTMAEGLEGEAAMHRLRSKYDVRFVISTEKNIVHMLNKGVHYWIKLPKIDAPDSTGVGDILLAAFSCAFLKERDPLWAICFGAGAVQAALEKKGIGIEKIPSKSYIEQNAAYIYNTISYKKI